MIQRKPATKSTGKCLTARSPTSTSTQTTHVELELTGPFNVGDTTTWVSWTSQLPTRPRCRQLNPVRGTWPYRSRPVSVFRAGPGQTGPPSAGATTMLARRTPRRVSSPPSPPPAICTVCRPTAPPSAGALSPQWPVIVGAWPSTERTPVTSGTAAASAAEGRKAGRRWFQGTLPTNWWGGSDDDCC